MPFHDGPITGSTMPNGKKRVALVIGNSAYVHAAPLANPKNDAEGIADALQRLDFKVLKGVDLGLNEFLTKKREFDAQIGGVDVALLYYAGHGLQVNGLNYLVPVDAEIEDIDDLQFKSIQLDFILDSITHRAKASLIFLDACRNNPFTRNLARSMGDRSGLVRTGLAEVKTKVSGTFIAFATSPDDTAEDGHGKNSPYTTALLNHIEREGVSLGDMMIDVRKEVLETTKRRQKPWENTSLESNFYFKPKIEPAVFDPVLQPGPVSPAPDDRAREAAVLWDTIKDSNNPTYFQDFINRYAESVFAPHAQERLDALIKAEHVAWGKLEQTSRVSEIDDFLKTFPGGANYEKAVKRRAEIKKEREETATWEEIRDSTDLAKLEAFLKKFPDGTPASQARERIEALKRQEELKIKEEETKRRHDEAWETVKESDDAEKLEAFIKDWPNSPHIREARKMLRQLQGKKAPVAAWLSLAMVLITAGGVGYWYYQDLQQRQIEEAQRRAEQERAAREAEVRRKAEAEARRKAEERRKKEQAAAEAEARRKAEEHRKAEERRAAETNETDCWEKSGDARLKACTQIIESGRLYGKPINDSNLALMYYNRGTYYYANNQHDKAISDYSTSIAKNPAYPNAWYNRGIVYQTLKQDRKALADYDQAIKLNPKHAKAYYGRGTINQILGLRDKARADYKKALEIDPSHELAAKWLKSLDEGAGSASTTATGNDKDCWEKTGDTAIQACTKVISSKRLYGKPISNKNLASTHTARGIAYAAKKNYDQAIADYTEAIRLNPNHVNAYGNRGIAYQKSGQYEKAIRDYEAALKRDKTYSSARKNLDALQAWLKQNK